MKKNLLILAFAAPLLAFGQTTFYVGNGASVKVKKSTLVHTNGAFKVENGAKGVSNEGNVNVQGPFTGNADGSKFVNEFESGTQYGQLIIKNGETVTGKMTGNFRFGTPDQFPYQHMAFPFVEYSAAEAVSQSEIEPGDEKWLDGTDYTERYKSSIFKANNVNYRIDHIKGADKNAPLEPTGGYSINQYSSNLRNHTTDKELRKSFVGKPNNNNKTENQGEFNLSSVKNFDTNIYGEHYGSYIIDPSRTMPTSWQEYRTQRNVSAGDYGRNLYTLGNPYTSNIDISNVKDHNIDAVVVYSANNYGGVNAGSANEYLQDKTKVTFYTASSNSPVAGGSIKEFGGPISPGNSTAIGDDIKFIRPFQTFDVRTKTGHALNYTFNDLRKTFELEDTNAFHFSKGTRNTDTGIYQVGLDLYQGEENTGASLYVVAADFYQPNGNSEYEAYNVWSSKEDKVELYSVQENADGTIAEGISDQKVYINGINATDYVAKPVYLAVRGEGNAPYTFKVRLNEALLNSKNIFYFEDKKEGKVMEITPNFEYTFVEPTLNKERFVIYWNGLPQTMATQDIASSQTQVYKDGVDHKVRFAVEFNRADVYVYDLNGRLVSAEKSIDTASDYTLPYLAKGNVFVVKVVGDNGVVTTQKIIK